MRRAFAQLAWGLGFELIDVKISEFDLLPDVVGYGLIVAGLSKLGLRNARYRWARNAAGALLVLSVLSALGLAQTEYSLTGGIEPSVNVLALTGMTLAIELAMYFGICDGIRLDAAERGKMQLAESAGKRWRLAFAAGVVMQLLLPFQLNYSVQEMFPVLLLSATALLISGLSVLFLARRAAREVAANPENGDGDTDGGAGAFVDLRL
ncbi:hypothetical protein [Cohnella hongkongensis]|uniref:Uncharacterized protein n=1 Tax=Cohnella hongkongensis TaxID=178337 RepID=A0ABV9F8W6_9BACL